VPTVLEAGWAMGPVWVGSKNLASIGVRALDRSAPNESQYRLCCPSHPPRLDCNLTLDCARVWGHRRNVKPKTNFPKRFRFKSTIIFQLTSGTCSIKVELTTKKFFRYGVIRRGAFL
jgi:hypothetical protein